MHGSTIEMTQSDLGLTWTPWNVTNGPGARHGAAIAYDGLDGYIVMFSGAPASGPYVGDTWAYANGTWRELCSGTTAPPTCSTSPSRDNEVPMVYDAADRYLLMLNSSGSTWSFANGNWTQRAVNQSLGSGHDAAMAYDPAIHKVLLVLPSASSYCLTYEYSNGTWTQVSTFYKIPNRINAVLFFDPTNSRIVLFGGADPSGSYVYDDEWTFSGGQWLRESPASVPPEGVPAGSAYDAPAGRDILLTGGIYGNYTWVFAKGNWTNQSGYFHGAPSPRVLAQMAYDGADGYVILFGGENLSSTINDTWVLWDPLSLYSSLSPSVIDLGQPFEYNSTLEGGVRPYTINYPGLPLGCVATEATTNFTCHPTESGTFTVTETASARLGGNLTTSQVIQVNPDPTAETLVAPNPTTEGVPVMFTSILAGGSAPFQVNWTFGDGSYFLDQAVSHDYAAPGSYEANLTARDSRGVYVNASVTVIVNPRPVAAATVDRNVTDAGLVLHFNATSYGGTRPVSYSWQFGDGNETPVENPTHSYSRAGAYTAVLTVTDALRIPNSTRFQVEVNPDPLLIASSNVSSTIANDTVRFASAASGGTGPFSYLWNFGDGSSSNASNVTHAYSSPGRYTVTLTLSDALGFTRTSTFVVEVVRAGAAHGPVAGGTPPGNALLFDSGLTVLGVVVGASLTWLYHRRQKGTTPSSAQHAARSDGAPEAPEEASSEPQGQ